MKFRAKSSGRRIEPAPLPGSSRWARQKVFGAAAGAGVLAVGGVLLIWWPGGQQEGAQPPVAGSVLEEVISDFFVPVLSVPTSDVSCSGELQRTTGATQTCRVETVVAPVDVEATYVSSDNTAQGASAENFDFTWSYDTPAEPVKQSVVSGFVQEQMALPYPGSKEPVVEAACDSELPLLVGAVAQCPLVRDGESLLALVQVSEIVDGEPRLALVSFDTAPSQ